MLHKIPKEQMFVSNLGWLESRFHFSFDQYKDINNTHFGVLRVLNDDIIHANSGFELHPHKNMEIISYVVEGEITHKDSMGNEETLKKGEVQYMSAGTGVWHSEHNKSEADLRLLQIWILPPVKEVQPLYGSFAYKEEERKNQLLNIVSSQSGKAKIKIYQDINIYVCELDSTQEINFFIKENRQIYFVQIEGSSLINGVSLFHGDALKVQNERELSIKAEENSHFLFIEMQQA